MPTSPAYLNGPTKETFQVRPPFLCPYHNDGSGETGTYSFSEAFAHNPFTIPARLSSGSPVILDADGKFFGFMNDAVEAGNCFSYDGKSTLTIEIPEGQRLFVDENGGDAAWKQYNSEVMATLKNYDRKNPPAFWSDLEYCTWAEQSHATGSRLPMIDDVIDQLDDAFVRRYIDELDRLDLPRGKFTIDAGWSEWPFDLGDWLVDERSFPEIEKTIAFVKDAGFTPGLWVAPVWIHIASNIAHAHPDFVGPQIIDYKTYSRLYWNYVEAESTYFDYFKKRIQYFYELGVRKFKCDMIYAEKPLMKPLCKRFYETFKSVNEDIEVEIHQPDIFFAPYGDTIRANDLDLSEPGWELPVQRRYEICSKSAAGKLLNLDFIGGGRIGKFSEKDYIRHIELMEQSPGHPIVSLLPSHLGEEACERARAYLNDYGKRKSARSTFFA